MPTTLGLLQRLFQPPCQRLHRAKAHSTAANTADIFTGPRFMTTTAPTAATPSSTKHIGLLQLRLLPSQRSYRIVREHPTLTVSRSERFNATVQDHPSRLLDYRPSTALLLHLPRTARRHRFALGALQHDNRPPFIGLFSSSSYIIRFQDQPTACQLHIFAEHQLRIRESTTPRGREICWQGTIAFSRT